MRHGDLGESAQQRTEMVRTLSFDCVFCVLCVCVVLLVPNLNYSLTTLHLFYRSIHILGK